MSGTHKPVILGIDCGATLAKAVAANEDLFAQADAVFAGRAFLDQLDCLRGQCRLCPIRTPLEKIFAQIADFYDQGKKILVLADGDPLFFGIGATLVKALPHIGFVVKSGISCMQAACSRISLPWQNVRAVSLHGRNDFYPLFALAAGTDPVCVLTDASIGPDLAARALLDRGADRFIAHIFENMGGKNEACSRLPLADCARMHFSSLSTMLLVPESPEILPANTFYGQYSTKAPIRGAVCQAMKIDPADFVWDIGAGSGVLSLEFAALAHRGRVAAIEKNPQRALDIQQNRFQARQANLEIIFGHAPACLRSLGSPQKIFIGGGLSGPEAEELLEYCALRLAPGGCLAICCILLESFILGRDFCKKTGWQTSVEYIQANCATPLGSGEKFTPHNPVFLLRAQKPL